MISIFKLLKQNIPWLWNFIESLNGILVNILFGTSINNAILKNADYKQIGKYTYRELLKSDLQGLTDLLSKQPDGFDQYFKPHKFDIDSLRLMFENKSFKMLGVFDDSEIVGYFFIRFFANKKAFRGKMVDSNHQRQGIAKNIGRITTNIALDAGFRLFATISKNNFSSWYSSSAVNEIRIIKELPNNYLYIEYTKIKD